MKCKFVVGQKVVCVNNAGNGASKYLVKDSIYTIESIYSGSSNFIFVMLQELSGLAKGGWFPERFEPLVERKTDISIFQKLVAPSKQKELV